MHDLYGLFKKALEIFKEKCFEENDTSGEGSR